MLKREREEKILFWLSFFRRFCSRILLDFIRLITLQVERLTQHLSFTSSVKRRRDDNCYKYEHIMITSCVFFICSCIFIIQGLLFSLFGCNGVFDLFVEGSPTMCNITHFRFYFGISNIYW